MNNHQPISLPSNIKKIIENLIHSRLNLFLSKNNEIYEKQFGFRPNHSTTHALEEVMQDVMLLDYFLTYRKQLIQ